MIVIRTTEKINWGGRNPFINNVIEIEMSEILRDSSSITFNITDRVIIDTPVDSLIPSRGSLVINNKRVIITVSEYNNLFQLADDYIKINNPDLSIFNREALRPSIALLLYFQNDKIMDESNNEFCLYGTTPNQWEVK